MFHIFRQFTLHTADRFADFRGHIIQIHARIELERHPEVALFTVRADGAQTGHACHSPLHDRGDFRVHGFWRGTRIIAVDTDIGVVDIRKLTHFHGKNGGRAGKGNQQVDDQYQNRAANTQTGEVIDFLNVSPVFFIAHDSSPSSDSPESR